MRVGESFLRVTLWLIRFRVFVNKFICYGPKEIPGVVVRPKRGGL